ncbi:MAG: hypothetical protein WC142_05160 [Bacteroidales bacterium]|jgi:cell division protein FtsQ|nr:hypothetical protein [Bacteroidales bacterium]MDD3691576.1 hypothetical protein [Bacteroidales bacterium]MDD4045018.1 hypothetical protein [Bacteroidales bacterium]MDD4582026.1 hypothetical protein [Bacteroidales bacterium]MDX9889711.1 hypothetical protein [Bacteroidales bacterium]
MNKKRLIISILLILIVIGAFIANAIISKNKTFQKVVYQITYPSDTLFTEKELDTYLKDSCGILIGKLIRNIRLNEIEQKLSNYPYLQSVEVLANSRGHLIIKAKQYKIIAHVFNLKQENYYISETGFLVPSSTNGCERVLIVNGNIAQTYHQHFDIKKHPKNKLYGVWKLAQFIENDAFWKAQIAQIYINLQQEMELVPVVGDHIILFGKSKNIEEKFKNLKYIYTKGFNISGWNKFSSINLKFGNQIPCEKRN